MPVAHPEEFRRRAVGLARTSGQPISKISKGLGINEQTLRTWLARAEVEEGKREGLTSDERKELVELRRRNRVLEMELEIVKKASAYFARENILPKLRFRLVRELADDGVPVAAACRVLGVSRSGHYEQLVRPPSLREVADESLTRTIREPWR
ncbi:transposase [Segniliparus rotundus]|uniref:transposase n=1 Tax=Segniliparus rotundus TaxID=286802 RepID=UPI0002F988B8|nr:transposase [Segniliparus rotundus]